MSFQDTPEQRMLRETVRKVAARFGHRYYVEQARKDLKASELWAAMAEQGIVGVNIPEAYGGAGMGMSELAIACEELARAGCPLLMLVVTSAISASVITKHGTEEQKRSWLPRLASGAAKMAFAITEPDAGSNSHRISTTARPSGSGDYLLTGSKCFISGVDESEAILVVARTGEDAKGRAALSLFIVDTKSPGLQAQLIPMEMVAPEKQFLLFFEDVRVPASARVAEEGAGLKVVFSGLNPERVAAAANSIGIGRYALDRASAYARERKVWSAPIGTHQGIAHPLAKAAIELELAALMTRKAAWLVDQGEDAGEAANMAKYAAAEASLFALDQAVQTHGGNGLSSEYGLADMWGVARLLRTAPVSREMILNHVAQHTLGLPRSY